MACDNGTDKLIGTQLQNSDDETMGNNIDHHREFWDEAREIVIAGGVIVSVLIIIIGLVVAYACKLQKALARAETALAANRGQRGIPMNDLSRQGGQPTHPEASPPPQQPSQDMEGPQVAGNHPHHPPPPPTDPGGVPSETPAAAAAELRGSPPQQSSAGTSREGSQPSSATRRESGEAARGQSHPPVLDQGIQDFIREQLSMYEALMACNASNSARLGPRHTEAQRLKAIATQDAVNRARHACQGLAVTGRPSASQDTNPGARTGRSSAADLDQGIQDYVKCHLSRYKSLVTHSVSPVPTDHQSGAPGWTTTAAANIPSGAGVPAGGNLQYRQMSAGAPGSASPQEASERMDNRL